MLNFVQENCVRSLFVQSSCDACMTICPHSAITLGVQEVKFDDEACTDCGLCVTACEQGALYDDAYQFKYPSLKNKQEGYACLATEKIEDVMRLPCLGMLDETELLTQADLQKSTIHLWSGNCEECSWKNGGIELREKLNKVKGMAAQLQIPFEIEFHEEENSMYVDENGNKKVNHQGKLREGNRRDFFFKGFKWLEKNSMTQLQKKADEVIEQVEAVEHFWIDSKSNRMRKTEEDTLHYHMQKKVTKRRFALLQLIKSQDLPITEPVKGLAIPKEINALCDACQVCVHACPTGALHGKAVNEKFQITFLANYCLNCTVCVDVCPQEAMLLTDEYISTLFTAQQKQCKKCRDDFVPKNKSDNLCIICKNKSNLLI